MMWQAAYLAPASCFAQAMRKALDLPVLIASQCCQGHWFVLQKSQFLQWEIRQLHVCVLLISPRLQSALTPHRSCQLLGQARGPGRAGPGDCIGPGGEGEGEGRGPTRRPRPQLPGRGVEARVSSLPLG